MSSAARRPLAPNLIAPALQLLKGFRALCADQLSCTGGKGLGRHRHPYQPITERQVGRQGHHIKPASIFTERVGRPPQGKGERFKSADGKSFRKRSPAKISRLFIFGTSQVRIAALATSATFLAMTDHR